MCRACRWCGEVVVHCGVRWWSDVECERCMVYGIIWYEVACREERVRERTREQVDREKVAAMARV